MDYPALRWRTPRFWLLTVAAVLGICAAAALCRWQLARAAQKEALQASIDRQAGLPELAAQQLFDPDRAAAAVHRRIVLRGTWLAGHTVFLDNRQMHGMPGFFVLTPLQLEGTGQAVMVQRGWMRRDFMERERLPAVATPVGIVEVRGSIAPPPAKLYQFAANETGPIRQNLDLPAFASERRLALRTDLSILQYGSVPDGLQRDWPRIASGVEKHYGYAFQWAALGVVIASLYAWFQFIAPIKVRARS